MIGSWTHFFSGLPVNDLLRDSEYSSYRMRTDLTAYAVVRARTADLTIGLFGERPFTVLAYYPDLRWLWIRNVARTSEHPDVIVSRLDHLLSEIQVALDMNELEVFDHDLRQRGGVFDLLVLTVSRALKHPGTGLCSAGFLLGSKTVASQ